jgi:hypothetical protein
MWGNGYNNTNAGGLGERITDNWIQQNIPGGVNSKFDCCCCIVSNRLVLGAIGEQLDNMMGGNPNPTAGQYYGGAPGVGGYSNSNTRGW